MSGIKDLTILIHWIDNSKEPTLEASLYKKRKIPRERQLILNELHDEVSRGSSSQKNLIGIGSLRKEKLSREA